ncbi:MAG: hypothetical protein HY722_10645 [Planctomycetes bacterium]|nr:hypothetical protein [Planctomycetota bacterium]
MTDWDALTEAFLHDPPDKALGIPGHEARASRYLAAAGIATSGQHGRHDDALAAVAERLPMPDGRHRPEKWDGISVGPRDGSLRVVHPLAGVAREVQVPGLDEAGIEDAIRDVVGGRGGRERFLALWRLLPAALARRHPAYAVLPADTRTPDHTLWHHADVTAAFQATLSGGGPAFLSVSIGPVQGFIATARTLRDLWSGSCLLSHLAFRGLLPLVEALGPQCLVFPHLRGNPHLDR